LKVSGILNETKHTASRAHAPALLFFDHVCAGKAKTATADAPLRPARTRNKNGTGFTPRLSAKYPAKTTTNPNNKDA
jgi:hypothetical protein